MFAHGASGLDIVGSFFRLAKWHEMDESLKLDFVKVTRGRARARHTWTRTRTQPGACARRAHARRAITVQEIGFTHMRVLDGLDTLLQLTGLVAKLCVNGAKHSRDKK